EGRTDVWKYDDVAQRMKWIGSYYAWRKRRAWLCSGHSSKSLLLSLHLIRSKNLGPYSTVQKSMPPPGPPGMARLCFFGSSATMASVVMSRPATEAAPCSAARTTLVGSMIPFEMRLPYSPAC